jgi:hypothetical protein
MLSASFPNGTKTATEPKRYAVTTQLSVAGGNTNVSAIEGIAILIELAIKGPRKDVVKTVRKIKFACDILSPPCFL